jgi:tRNA nucleotidyltransferase/poly(A) polymerase
VISNLFEIDGSVSMSDFGKIFTPEIKRIIGIVRKYGFDIRVVGGAVRDFLLGKAPRDVDFATDAMPAELMFIFDLEGIEHDDSGIRHGTIKAVFGDEKIDVTTMDYRMKVSNGRVVTKHASSWKDDSKHRDFTINSMSVDMDGNLYDYHGGQEDLKRGMVRFTSDPQGQIDEDPNRILRWFKALSMFENPRWLANDRRIIERNASRVTEVANSKRSQKLLANIKESPRYPRVLRLMCQMGVAQHLDLNCGA